MELRVCTCVVGISSVHFEESYFSWTTLILPPTQQDGIQTVCIALIFLTPKLPNSSHTIEIGFGVEMAGSRMSVQPYRELIGRRLEYTDKNGIRKSAQLLDIGWSAQDDGIRAMFEPTAWTQFVSLCCCSDEPPVVVPLDQVILPRDFNSQPLSNTNVSRNVRTSQPSSRNVASPQIPLSPPYLPRDPQPRVSDNVFQFDQSVYHGVTLSEYKVGDEVVWMLNNNSQWSTERPYVGKIKFTGQCFHPEKGVLFVALVEFDQSTTHLPRCIPQTKNRNLVDVNELLKLADWIETQHPPVIPTPAEPKAEVPSLLPKITNRVTENDENNDLINLEGSKEIAKIAPIPDRGSTRAKLWKEPIRWDDFNRKISSRDQLYGIQGHNNSCYMDSSVFALFAFSHAADKLIVRRSADCNQIQGTVKKILRKDIVDGLRQNYFVPHQNMDALRRVFVERISLQYLKSYMDAEEFLFHFFELIQAPEFLEYNHGGKDYIHQIMLPFDSNSANKVPYISLQKLLEQSFAVAGVKLARRPSDIFIVKLPVSDGVLVPCDGVVPNLTLDLSNLIDGDNEAKSRMTLSAVICLRRNHFVTFVRSGQEDNSEWVLMDSCPTTSRPQMVILPDGNEVVKKAEDKLDNRGIGNSDQIVDLEGPDGNYKLFRDAYICIYSY